MEEKNFTCKKLKNNQLFIFSYKIAITILIIFLLLQFVIGIHFYYGNNMNPALKDGSLVITYKLDKNIYSDLVVYYEYDSIKQFGRICGVPGDIINITEEGKYTINGNIPLENIFYNTFPNTDGIIYPYTVPEGSYFIMNDYRENTSDSRKFGAVPIKNIEGQEYIEIQRRGF